MRKHNNNMVTSELPGRPVDMCYTESIGGDNLLLKNSKAVHVEAK